LLNSTNHQRDSLTIRVVHDLQRQILEIPSFIRVLNNYYYKKVKIQNKVKSIIAKKFKDGLTTLENSKDWLYSIPTTLTTLSDDLLSKKDSFKFPDSIILFEAWMNLGVEALYPRFALHYKFPGLLKGEKARHVIQFTFSTSRGFGFPIYFGPEFYGYILTYGKLLESILKWSHTVCHRANQAIYLVGTRFNINRHHPGEFESVIISEYKNNRYKGINTLLHGYFTKDPKSLGTFSNLEEVLQNVLFSYSIGDHAINIESKKKTTIKHIPLITHNTIVERYKVDFYSYIKQLLSASKLLNTKIAYYRAQRKNLINKLNRADKLKFRFNQSKNFTIPSLKISDKFSEIENMGQYMHLMEGIKDLLWTTPLYTHTIHKPTFFEIDLIDDKKPAKYDNFEQEPIDSIFLSYIQYYQKKYNFIFEEREVIDKLEYLKDDMAKMWLYFKERQFSYALKNLNKFATIGLDDPNYSKIVNESLNILIPIFSIYEIFNRPLFESVYPESIPQTKRLGSYLASFLTSRYNPLGVNLMNLFNKLAFRNWSYFILKNKLNRTNFFNFILKLPIWKNIPLEIKKIILKVNSN